MNKMTRRSLGVAGFALVLVASTSFAQQQNVRVRGTVEKADGNMITVKSRDGADLTLKLKDDAVVRGIVKASLADVKGGSMVGITSMPQADGSLKAVEVHIFPANQNVNQTHSQWDLMPNTMMTNGQVQTSVAAVDGQVLTVQYKMGDKVDEKKISITPQTVIVSYVPSDKAELKPGVKVFVANAPKAADGTIDVSSISYGKDGMTPPM